MKTWVAGEETLAVDFQAFLQEQVVPKFANPTARDSQWTSPANGSVCVCTDTNTFFQRIAGVWYTPYARLARVVKSTTTTGIGTGGFDMADTASLVIPGTRLLTLKGKVNLTTATASGAYIFGKIDSSSATSRLAQLNNINGVGGGAILIGSETITVSTTPHTFRLSIVGIGTSVDLIGATDAAIFEVWDAGPG